MSERIWRSRTLRLERIASCDGAFLLGDGATHWLSDDDLREFRVVLDALLGDRPAWLLVAADRMAAGEPEADVMRDYGWRREEEA